MTSFLKPTELLDVTEILWADGSAAIVLAGGTDLLTRPRPFDGRNLVIDISSLKELQGIAQEERGTIRIGAGVTHQQIVDDPLLRRRARLLTLACGSVGSVQIRNRGTLGGNLGNASPAADSLPALVCLDAKVHLVSRDRSRDVPLHEFFSGPGQTVMGMDELIHSVAFSGRQGHTVAFFKKAGQRAGMCCAKATVAFTARRHGDGRLSEVKIAMGAVAATVIPVPAACRVLEGQVLNEEAINGAAQACVAAASPISDIRSTAEYRRLVVGALLTEGLLEVLDHMHAIRKRREARKRRGVSRARAKRR